MCVGIFPYLMGICASMRYDDDDFAVVAYWMAEDDESNNVVLNEYELSNGSRSHSFGNYLSPRLNMTSLLQLSVKKRIFIVTVFDYMRRMATNYL